MSNSLGAGNFKSFLLVVPVLILAAGCVSKATHQELINSYSDLNKQKDTLEKSCAENTEDLLGQIGILEENSAELNRQNRDLALRAEGLAREKEAEAAALQEMVGSLEQKLAGEEARISQLENSLKIEVIDKLMFASGSAAVTREGSKIIAKIAPTLISAADQDIVIIGHTDDLPPSADLARKYPSNWELSAARAASIAHILIWNYKIAPDRITIQGAAHYHPLTAFNTKDQAARKTNRAVEIILKPQ